MTQIKADKISLVPIHEIIPNPKNRNIHPENQIDLLCKIIQAQGFREPLIVSVRSGFLIAGHGRLAAAKKLGMEKLPVIRQHFDSEAQEYQHMVSDNEIARWANLDVEGLRSDIKEFSLDEFDIEILGIEDFKIEDIDKTEKEEKEESLSFDYKIEIDCKSEAIQRQILQEMEDRGFKVRILI